MAPAHMDRLTAIDASFLTNESDSSHMHIGAVLIFEGPPPLYADFADHVRSRLHLVPRYRQKLAFPPAQTGRPLWIDDTTFNLMYHVRHSALPSPGSEEQLRNIAGRIYAQQLDRSKPLWELWLVQGLAENRFALIVKTHHAVIDGIAGVDLATVLFDMKPVPEPTEPQREWVPAPTPTATQMAARGAMELAELPLRTARRAISMLTHPSRSAHQVGEAAEGIGEIAWAFLDPAPEVPLNVEIGSHRRFIWVRCKLADFREIKSALGGTVNDVVLASVSGGLRHWLQARGVRVEGLELRALVPVSVRAEGTGGELGNQLLAIRGPLPVYIDDPVRRLDMVRAEMDDLKESKQALGAEVISRFNDFAPPTLLAQAARINFSTRLFNLIVTNVPGPQMPLFVLGRELQDAFPVAFLPTNHALAIAIMSYNGEMGFGLLADYDSMEDVEVIARGIEDSVAELLEAARGAGSSRERELAAGE